MKNVLYFIIIPILILSILTYCFYPVNEKDVIEYSKIEGWTDVKVTGYKFFKCGADDYYHTGFEAKKNGQKITGVVCSGFMLKGKTLRLD